MCSARLDHVVNLNDVLGPPDERFFGGGYRRVRHEVSGSADADGHYVGTGCALYPDDWSVDRRGELRTPHLSTVDAVVLPLLALERNCPTAHQRYVSALAIRAGGQPWMGLDSVPMRLTTTPPDRFDVASVNAEIGNMLVKISLSRLPEQSLTDTTVDKHQEPFHRAHDDFYQLTHCETFLCESDLTRGQLNASHAFTVPESALSAVEIEGRTGNWWPSMTIVDYLVTMGQLAQVVFADQVKSDQRSGNLWMRMMSLELTSAPSRVPCEITSQTTPLELRQFERGRHQFHDLSIESHTSNGVCAKAKLAQVSDR